MCGFSGKYYLKTHICATLVCMNSRVVTPSPPSSQLNRIPKWAMSRGAATREAAAAFAADSAVATLDNLVWSEPRWAGCWRARQALSSAAAAVKWLGSVDNRNSQIRLV